MELSNLTRDSARIEAGEWVGDLPGMGDLRVKVRGTGSKIYTSVVSRLGRAVPKGQRNRDGSLLPETSLRIAGEAIHEAILLDWDGLSEGGKPVKFDKDLAKKLLTDPDYRPFFDAVVLAATIVENGRGELAEELEKNSERSSPGNSNTAA